MKDQRHSQQRCSCQRLRYATPTQTGRAIELGKQHQERGEAGALGASWETRSKKCWRHLVRVVCRMPRCRAASHCQNTARHTCNVCQVPCCPDHAQGLRTYGPLHPSRETYCTSCYELLLEHNGTDRCYQLECKFLTNSKCSICHEPCCSDHSLIEHVDTKENIEAHTLNKRTICDTCAHKKHFKNRVVGGSGVGGLILLGLAVWLLSGGS